MKLSEIFDKAADGFESGKYTPIQGRFYSMLDPCKVCIMGACGDAADIEPASMRINVAARRELENVLGQDPVGWNDDPPAPRSPSELAGVLRKAAAHARKQGH